MPMPLKYTRKIGLINIELETEALLKAQASFTKLLYFRILIVREIL